MAENIRVVLADDHAVVRTGYRRLLELEPDLVLPGETPIAALAAAIAPDAQPVTRTAYPLVPPAAGTPGL